MWMISTEGDSDYVVGGYMDRKEFEKGCGEAFEVEFIAARSVPSPTIRRKKPKKKKQPEGLTAEPDFFPLGPPRAEPELSPMAPRSEPHTVVIPSVAALGYAAYEAVRERVGRAVRFAGNLPSKAGYASCDREPQTPDDDDGTKRIKWRDPIVSIKYFTPDPPQPEQDF